VKAVLQFTAQQLPNTDVLTQGAGVHRLEARTAVRNGRGNGALLKVGAVQECVLRKAFQRDGCYMDQLLYSILEEDWRAPCDAPWRSEAPRVH
jgi:RimJ/RimL family protein N-acetyltransferase